VRGFDINAALTSCLETADNRYYEGAGDYQHLGYVPEKRSGNSASVTLEYAFDDYSLSRLAYAISKDSGVDEQVRMQAGKEFLRYQTRSQNFRNIWDDETRFMRPRHSDGSWKKPFDPLSTHGQGFIEGNSWNYSFHVPQDVPALIHLMGGEKAFITRLDSLFTMHLDDIHFTEKEDVPRVGLIGNYVHGNKPSHHIPYLYNWTSQSWKTQEKVRLIMNTMYRNTPDGLCGNDDCGQMSAWYLFSALGFYPVCPADGRYYFGIPLSAEIRVKMPGGKTLTILANGLSDERRFIQKIRFNGREIYDNFLDHQLIVQRGLLEFEMGPEHP
jgi:predicted alpha-1,2-mannosidase